MKNLIRKILKESSNELGWLKDIANDDSINESNDFDWVNDILDNQTLTNYRDNKELVKYQDYLMTGKWQVGDSGSFIDLPSEGIKVRFLVSTRRTIEFRILEGFKVRDLDGFFLFYDPNDILFLTYKDDSDILFLKPLNINESNDFDWISNIKPEINWGDVKPEDLIGRNFILIDRNRLYTIEGYDESTGQFNIHNHETNKKRKLSLSEIESLVFMGDIEFEV